MTQVLEGDDFSILDFYNALQYQTIGPKLKVCQSGLFWHTLTKDKPYFDYKIKFDRKIKNMVPYAYLGVRIYCAETSTFASMIPAADTTAINHVACSLMTRFNEWNQGFDHDRV